MISGIHPGNFEMLSRLNELDLCNFFLTKWQPELDHYSVLKSPHNFYSLRHESISKGVWHYLWVFRVNFYLFIELIFQISYWWYNMQLQNFVKCFIQENNHGTYDAKLSWNEPQLANLKTSSMITNNWHTSRITLPIFPQNEKRLLLRTFTYT